MKKIFLILSLIFSFNLYAHDYGFAYCYVCTPQNKKTLAEAKVNHSRSKIMTIINHSTRNLTTYKVNRIVAPETYTVNTFEIATPSEISELIDDVYVMVDALKNEASNPINVRDLPGYGNPNFPTVAHNLVDNNLAQQWLINAVSDHLTLIANSSSIGTTGTSLATAIAILINLVGSDELTGVEFIFVFDEGSSVVMKINELTIDGTTWKPVINVVQKPNSLRDSEGNPIPDTTEDFSDISYYLGNPGNIAYWGNLVNRLRAVMAGFGQVCSWESENHVHCEAM
jgi:hypothetical protein